MARKIKLIKPYRTLLPGEIFDETEEKCKELVDLGVAEYVQERKKKILVPEKKKRGYKTKSKK